MLLKFNDLFSIMGFIDNLTNQNLAFQEFHIYCGYYHQPGMVRVNPWHTPVSPGERRWQVRLKLKLFFGVKPTWNRIAKH